MSYKPKYKRSNNNMIDNYTQSTNFNTNNDFNPFDKNYWGPKAWEIMHIFSYSYPNNPTLTEKQNAFNFYSSIGHLLPCHNCQQHCIQYVTNNPPHINSREELINWVLNFHNEVNIRLNKQIWSRQKLDKKFMTDNAVCI